MARKKRNRGGRRRSNRLKGLIDAQDGCCFYCGEAVLDKVGQDHPLRATTDHKIPRARGGSNRVENCVAACFGCNNLKGHLTDEEFFALFPNGIRGCVGDQIRARVRVGSHRIAEPDCKPELPDNLKFIDDMAGVVLQVLDRAGQHYRLTLPNGVQYDFWPSTGSWTRIGSFVWTKGMFAADKFRSEIERMMNLMAELREYSRC